MRRILIISNTGESYGFAKLLARENIEVGFCLSEKNYISRFAETKGVQLLSDWRGFVFGSDAVIFDAPGSGELAESFREAGKVVLGGSLLLDKAVSGEQYLTELAELTDADLVTASINENVTASFDDSAAAVNINTNTQPLRDSIPITLTGWMTSKGWMNIFSHGFKYDRFQEQDTGMIAQMGDVLWNEETTNLVKALLLPLERFLIGCNYLGPFSVKIAVTPSDLYITGINPGFDFDAIYAFNESLMIPWKKFLTALIDGKKSIHISQYPSASVRLTLPPYPYSYNGRNLQDVLEIEKPAESHVHVSPFFAVVSAWGHTFGSTRKRIYSTIKNIVRSSDIQYRKDICEAVKDKRDTLREWDWVH